MGSMGKPTGTRTPGVWLGLLALAAALALTAALAAPALAGNGVDFWTKCGFVISGTFDPVVDPGSTTTPHFHDFFGATGISPASTPDSLRAAGLGATSCTTSTDTAAYWAPTLTLGPRETQTYHGAGGPCVTGAAGLPACHYTNIRAYYGLGGASRSLITGLPAQMEAVGGNPAATGVQGQNAVYWACGNTSPHEAHPYDCGPYINLASDADGVVMVVLLPSCWTGLAASDRASYAYPVSGTCPAGFPIRLPVVGLHFHTGIVTPCPGQSCLAGSAVAPAFGFEYADGTMMPWYQAHADFMNGWQRGNFGAGDNLGGLDDLVQDCLIAGQTCPPNPHTGPRGNNMPT